jgi:hypothetical protein
MVPRVGPRRAHCGLSARLRHSTQSHRKRACYHAYTRATRRIARHLARLDQRITTGPKLSSRSELCGAHEAKTVQGSLAHGTREHTWQWNNTRSAAAPAVDTARITRALRAPISPSRSTVSGAHRQAAAPGSAASLVDHGPRLHLVLEPDSTNLSGSCEQLHTHDEGQVECHRIGGTEERLCLSLSTSSHIDVPCAEDLTAPAVPAHG